MCFVWLGRCQGTFFMRLLQYYIRELQISCPQRKTSLYIRRSLQKIFKIVEFTVLSWCWTPPLTSIPWPQHWGSPAANTWSADIWLRRWKPWLAQPGKRTPIKHPWTWEEWLVIIYAAFGCTKVCSPLCSFSCPLQDGCQAGLRASRTRNTTSSPSPELP